MYIILFLLGLICGSFLNALIWRTHAGISILRGRSMCPNCNTTLGPTELIPVVSFLLQRGRCQRCKTTISWQYPLVELATGMLFALTYLLYRPDVVGIVFGCTVVCVLMYIFVYDLRYQYILDRSTLPAILLIGVFHLIRSPELWHLYLIGCIVGGGFFLLQFIVSKGTWIGGGDIRLGALMGILLGWKLLLVALLVAYVVGAVVSLVLVAMKKKTLASTTPFGTYLSAATLIVLFWGQEILDWYLNILY